MMDFNSWNESFPDGMISKTEITEPACVRAFVAYLKKFGYKVDPPFPLNSNQVDNTRERRLFLISLTRSIDRILKISHKNYTFYYYDLIKPVPKKIANVLDILLNYYYYYNMYKNDVFKMVNDRLKERNAILLEIATIQRENEELEEKAKKIKDDMEKLAISIPEIISELNKWHKRKAAQEVALQKCHNELEQKKKKLIQLRDKEEQIKKQTVDNEDVQSLQKEKATLVANMEELKKQETVFQETMKERADKIKTSEKLREKIVKIKETLPPSVLSDYKELKAKVKECNLEINALKDEKASRLDALDKLKTNLESYEKDLENKKRQFHQEKLEAIQETADQPSVLQKKRLEINNLKNQSSMLEEELEEQREINHQIHEALTIIKSD